MPKDESPDWFARVLAGLSLIVDIAAIVVLCIIDLTDSTQHRPFRR